VAVLDGLTLAQAVAWVRDTYHRRVVERPHGGGGGCAASADPRTSRAAAAHSGARCCWSRALSASVHRTGGTTAAQPLTKSIA
jgi:hypothetical protein